MAEISYVYAGTVRSADGGRGGIFARGSEISPGRR